MSPGFSTALKARLLWPTQAADQLLVNPLYTSSMFSDQLRIFHNMLPVNERQYRLGDRRGHQDSTLCSHMNCYRIETMSHCLWQCDMPRKVLNYCA
ncbi:hypothetical protein L915_15082 [Phytophthora nicotianae]|uniref:Uncharacterized protein n=2 Tax=Phytophthora nicotianae TaxID=4792 RepID=V9EII2_PHYNI|nr:hypothetical protein F443_15529 [Phytophthora nicotianae P1569]ETK79026.1 hypothetical protein L915_15082 [Phytophthora nicotianae]ETM50220.1 hypothetical protein L914_05697 [Phytophthora nicotianae]